MKVFISWSGARSRIVAEALREWLPDVINAVEPFVSEEDIDKGAIGAEVIGRQLRDCEFGIICLTRDNQTRPWLNYEAGALSKAVGDNEARVATLLIDIDDPSGVTGPLSAFQATRLRDATDMKRLVGSIARTAGDTRTRENLDRVVDRMWETFVNEVSEARLAESGEQSSAPLRRPEDMFGELLTLIRQVSQDVARLTAAEVSSTEKQDSQTQASRNTSRMRLLEEVGKVFLADGISNSYSLRFDEARRVVILETAYDLPKPTVAKLVTIAEKYNVPIDFVTLNSTSAV